MRKVFYLKSCSTCKKIMKKFPLAEWELREIKSAPLTENELDELYNLSRSYEALFSKRSTQIKERAIEVNSLKEEDFKALILAHYSFLKRPVFVTDKDIFIGSDKANLEKLSRFFEQ
ncbi:arsenate reductase family protein [Elizabethkingia argentiflava]|uniref:Arsenate reductase family protein n=1 Tax=Elizabethkingia argenteiflava TaxID=2681556 RepID=A0A845PU56_9FLAO|nr:ArsC/Spx/MgsR family protein [Elizabethkingia argenteiflava]NAW51762.1 arsenate reductase family protein [Elizabethkingia argenteiflava]